MYCACRSSVRKLECVQDTGVRGRAYAADVHCQVRVGDNCLLRTLLHFHCAGALRPAEDCGYSWEALSSQHAADLDHVLLFPASAGIS
eukprot:2462595-Rhodomonas_salina.1